MDNLRSFTGMFSYSNDFGGRSSGGLKINLIFSIINNNISITLKRYLGSCISETARGDLLLSVLNVTELTLPSGE